MICRMKSSSEGAASTPPEAALLAKLLPAGPKNTGWTASKAAQNAVPVTVTAGDKITAPRQWALGRCLSADRAGVSARSDVSGGGRVRSTMETPGVN